MAAYVDILKKMRKQIDSQDNSPQESPSSQVSTGIVSRVRQQSQAATQEQAQIQYSPSAFALNAIKRVRADKGSLMAKLNSAAEEGASTAVQAKSATPSLIGQLEDMTGDVVKKFRGKGLLDRPDPVEAPDGKKGHEVYDLPQKDGNAEVMGDKGFIEKVKAVASKYNVPVSQLLSTMHFETGGEFSSSTKNATGSGATGLIQIMPSTARALGTTTDKLAAMSRDEQLDYVDKYLDQSGLKNIKNPNGSDVYMSVFYPKAMGKDDNYKIFTKGSKGYEQNKGLDTTGKGYITKRDAAAKALQYVQAYEGV